MCRDTLGFLNHVLVILYNETTQHTLHVNSILDPGPWTLEVSLQPLRETFTEVEMCDKDGYLTLCERLMCVLRCQHVK